MSLKDITLGRYVYGTSLLHRLDPRTKLICMLLIMAGLFSGNRWQLLLVAGIYILLASCVSGLNPSYIMRSILPFKWLIILTFVLNALFVGGTTLIKAPLPYGGITYEGLMLGTLYGTRIGLLVLAASLLTLTTEPVVLVTGVEKLLAPLAKIKIKPHEVALAMIITIRFVPVLLDEAVKIRKSHAARGFNPKGLTAKIRSVSIILLPLFSSAIRRAEHLAVAMECRLYRSEATRTRFKEIKMSGTDWVTISVTILFLVFLIVI